MIERIDELGVFVAIAHAGSLSAAARRLRIPVNRVSRKLARLEERLQVTLVARTTRQLRLTSDGERFLLRAQRVLDEVDAAERALTQDAGLVGPLRLAIPTMLTQFGIIDAVQRTRLAYPRLALELLVQDAPVNLVDSGCDAAVVVGRQSDSTMTLIKLGRIVPLLAASASYLDEYGTPQHTDELAEHVCLRFIGDGPQTHWPLIGTDGRRRRVRVGDGFSSNNSRVLHDAMLGGVGIGLTSTLVLRQAPQLVQLLPDYHHVPFGVFALCPNGYAELPRSALAVELLRKGLQLPR